MERGAPDRRDDPDGLLLRDNLPYWTQQVDDLAAAAAIPSHLTSSSCDTGAGTPAPRPHRSYSADTGAARRGRIPASGSRAARRAGDARTRPWRPVRERQFARPGCRVSIAWSSTIGPTTRPMGPSRRYPYISLNTANSPRPTCRARVAGGYWVGGNVLPATCQVGRVRLLVRRLLGG